MRLLMIVLASGVLLGCNNLESLVTRPTSEESPPSETLITITAVGDMMLGSDYPQASQLPSRNILWPLKDSLLSGDFTLGNLEGVITQVEKPEKKCQDPKKCFAFRMPLTYAHYFKTAGFDFLNLANNHSGDFGQAGLVETMSQLKRVGIAYAGIRPHHEYAIIAKKGIRFGVIGAGFGWRHPHINHRPHLQKLIRKIRDSVSVLIVYFHGGAEGVGTEWVPPSTEFYHGENRGQVQQFARDCIDAGADMVLGSGPHVTRGLELYQNKLIAYSLGNYATYGGMSLNGPLGTAPILKVLVNKQGDFRGGRIISTRQYPRNDQSPMIDTAQTVMKRMRNLSKLNFPESPLEFTDQGALIFKNF